ncbi:hypothetical protein GCM10022207_44720 [Streptomyces lannensis]|uniref:Uncharacterized protein n=1 Tax=Streptomyces lannensis TaxID=766498 RepID=A0ABP7KGC7_9ACTN
MEDQCENRQCRGAGQQAAGVPARHDLRRSFGGAALIGFVCGGGHDIGRRDHGEALGGGELQA